MLNSTRIDATESASITQLTTLKDLSSLYLPLTGLKFGDEVKNFIATMDEQLKSLGLQSSNSDMDDASALRFQINQIQDKIDGMMVEEDVA